MSNVKKLEARLANTEQALMALHALIADILPPAVAEGTHRMMQEYFEANEKHGGFTDIDDPEFWR